MARAGAGCALAALSLALLPARAGTLEVTVVDKDGKPVPDAVVIATPAHAGGTPPTLASSAVIGQEKLQFVPALTVVAAGAKVSFENRDSFDHHVRGTRATLMGSADAAPGAGFELRVDGRKAGGAVKSQEVTLAEPGPILLGCHLHGSMRGYVYVAQSPWTLQTDAQGHASLAGLPDGAVQVRVWQAEQLLDLPPVAATTGATPVQVRIALQVVPRRRRI
ncbi:plastocyanin [Ramlibacter aquaticus]|uniref:Plastocyanin n=1 Tax=Ramlibacter aquaticus TaxID=2780094 RepID=A0ABR9SFU3_9BURK|nr:plastocyanin [Ramlibacter aquaticus]